MVLGVILICPENVLNACGGFEAELDVVSEDKLVPADRDEVTRHAVVLGSHSLGGDKAGFDCSEDLLTILVQSLKPLTQLHSLLIQSCPDHLIGTTF